MPYVDDKNLPEHIKKMSKKMREIWRNVWNNSYRKYRDEKKAFTMANGVIKRLKAEGALFEIQSDLGSVRGIKDLTPEVFEEYGANPSIAKYKPNWKIIEGRLFAADLPFCPSTEGITEGYYFVLPKETVEKSLWQLTNMPVKVNSDFSGHAEKTKEGKKYNSIGTILGAKMTAVGEENWVDVLCGLWENDYPTEISAISEKKDELGMSIEMFFEPETIEAVDFNILKVGDAAFKGLAILQKARAAFPQTQLLVASKFESEKQVESSVYNIEGEGNMDIKIESDGTVDGTVLNVGGKDIKGIQSMSFTLWQGESKPSFNYSLVEQEKDGFSVSKTYRLSAEGIEEVSAENLIEAAKWTRAYINDLPDSAFAVIEPAYKEGKIEDKSARHLPYKNKEGEIDIPHLRNALARMNQITPVSDSISAEELRKKAKAKLIPLAKKHLPTSQWAKAEGGETVMDYKGIQLSKETYTPQEIVEIFKSLDAEDNQKKVLAEKDTKIAELQVEIDGFKAKEVDAQKKKDEDAKIEAEKTAVAEAEKWFEANKDSYLPDNKEDVVAIRAKVELGTANKDEILKLAELKKKAGEISANSGETEEEKKEKLDKMFGIKNPVKK